MMNRAYVVTVAREWIGTPFAAQQSMKGVYADCAGFSMGWGKEIGVVAPEFDPGPWKQSPDGTMRPVCDQHLTRIDKKDIRLGDVVLMKFEKEPQHMAVIADYKWGGLSVVHALLSAGGVTEHRLDKKWRDCIQYAYSIPGIED